MKTRPWSSPSLKNIYNVYFYVSTENRGWLGLQALYKNEAFENFVEFFKNNSYDKLYGVYIYIYNKQEKKNEDWFVVKANSPNEKLPTKQEQGKKIFTEAACIFSSLCSSFFFFFLSSFSVFFFFYFGGILVKRKLRGFFWPPFFFFLDVSKHKPSVESSAEKAFFFEVP